MTFITLDNKNWCRGVYKDGELFYSELPENLDKTWKYASYLKELDVEYASIYALGKTISDVCPESLALEWEKSKQRLEAFYSSFKEAKVSLEDNCFFDLVPQQFLKELCETRCKIVDHVLENFKKPDNYDYLLSIEQITTDIADRELNVDLQWLRNNLSNSRARVLLEKVKKTKKVMYNTFGSKTGRLTTMPNTFPILNLDSNLRSVIKPKNDLFIELDYNSAEIRVLFALSGLEQPEGDIHSWNAKRLSITRDEAKKEIFAWLYGSSKVDSSKYKKLFNTKLVMEKFYTGETITTPFGRNIVTDDFHMMNYLIQSTTADLVFEQVAKIDKELNKTKSFISFLVHDSVVIDLAKEDSHIVNSLLRKFSDTRFGNLPVNLSAGKDYGNLRKL